MTSLTTASNGVSNARRTFDSIAQQLEGQVGKKALTVRVPLQSVTDASIERFMKKKGFLKPGSGQHVAIHRETEFTDAAIVELLKAKSGGLLVPTERDVALFRNAQKMMLEKQEARVESKMKKIIEKADGKGDSADRVKSSMETLVNKIMDKSQDEEQMLQRYNFLATRCSGCRTVRFKLEESLMKKCARCRTAIYCSKECQVAHWPQHKQVCVVATQAQVASAPNAPEASTT